MDDSVLCAHMLLSVMWHYRKCCISFSPLSVLFAVREEGFFSLWKGCSPAVLRHYGKFSTGLVCVYHMQVRWGLSKTATFGPALTDLYREVASLQK